MTLTYIAKDDRGNVGKTIPLTQGETRVVTVYLFDKDGVPFLFGGTLAEILVKIVKVPNSTSISKTFTGSGAAAVLPITVSSAIAGIIGFQFQLTAAETAAMTNGSLPMTALLTDSVGKVVEVDFAAVFNVSVPVVAS